MARVRRVSVAEDGDTWDNEEFQGFPYFQYSYAQDGVLGDAPYIEINLPRPFIFGGKAVDSVFVWQYGLITFETPTQAQIHFIHTYFEAEGVPQDFHPVNILEFPGEFISVGRVGKFDTRDFVTVQDSDFGFYITWGNPIDDDANGFVGEDVPEIFFLRPGLDISESINGTEVTGSAFARDPVLDGFVSNISIFSIDTGGSFTDNVSAYRLGGVAYFNGPFVQVDLDLPDYAAGEPVPLSNHFASLDGFFGTTEDPTVDQSEALPHVKVEATTTFAGVDYYTFTVTQANSRVILDLDFLTFDSELKLYDDNFNLIAENDDAGVLDPGSSSGLDSYIDFVISEPGVYQIGVFAFDDASIPAGAQYTLNVTLEGAIGYEPLEQASQYFVNLGFDDDVLIGNTANDYFSVADGNNIIDGGDGDDTLVTGQSADQLTGGAGNDTFLGYLQNFAGDTITDFAAGDRIFLPNISIGQVSLSQEGDVLQLNAEVSLTLTGSAGLALVARSAAGGGVEIVVNSAPVAEPDNFVTNENTPLFLSALSGILVNDSDVDGDPLSAVLVAGPGNGALSLNADGSFTYTPNANFNGLDSFSYQSSDGVALSEITSVTILVGPVNDAPIAQSDAYATNEDTALIVPAISGVLANDSDVDGDPLNATLVVGPGNGVLSLNADGSFTYTPDANFNGVDSFSYRATDGVALSEITSVTISVGPVNDAPIAQSDDYATDANTPLIVPALGGVLANDADIDGDTLSALLDTAPTNGVLSLNADGSFTYTPNLNFSGSDSFLYSADDGNGGSSLASVNVTILPGFVPGQSPTITSDGGGNEADVSVNEGTRSVTTVEATDPNDDPLTYSIVGGADAASFTINPETGALSFVDAPDFETPGDVGQDNTYEVIVSVSDGALSDTQSLTVTVEDRSVTPRLIAPDAFGGAYGGEGTIFLTTGHQDISIIERPGTISLVGPAGGDDVIRFDGVAGDYLVARSGSRVLISIDDTIVSIPISPIGINLVFADGIRTLGIDGGMIMLGSQIIGTDAAAITAPAEEIVLADLVDPAVAGILVVSEGIVPTIGEGRFDVFGTSFDVERLEVLSGTVALRTGFDGGADGVDLPDVSVFYSVSRLGSTVFLEAADTQISIPGSPGGTTLGFPDGDQYLRIDTDIGKLLIGEQEITGTPEQLSPDTLVVSADIGTPLDFGFLDAGGAAYVFTDDAAVPQVVFISNFTGEDFVRIEGATQDDLIILNYEAEGDGLQNDLAFVLASDFDVQFILLNVLPNDTPGGAVTDLASAQLATGFEILVFA